MTNNQYDITNLSQFDVSRTHENCTVITFDGLPGFAWYDKLGQRHNEGLMFPKMNVIRDATVLLLYNTETGERSAGWSKKKNDTNDDPENFGTEDGDI